MRILALASTALAFGLCTSAIGAEQDCDDCETYKKGIHRQVIPADNIVCIYFAQPAPDNVLLRIDLPGEKPRKYHRQNAGTEGKFCVGRHWVKRATSMYVCNARAHTSYDADQTKFMAGKPTYSHAGEACLYGNKKCKEMGYPKR